jgi:hypothetical protein
LCRGANGGRGMITNEQLADALEKVISRTKVERFRQLCADGTVRPWVQAQYQALVYKMSLAPRPESLEITNEEASATPAARRHGLTGPPRCGCGNGGSCSPRGAA